MRNCWSGAILLLAVIGGAARAQLTLQNGSTSFYSLGFLGNTTTHFSQANGVSADGTAVVGYSFSPAGQEAFSWNINTRTLVALGALGGSTISSQANAVSNATLTPQGSQNLVVGVSVGPNSGTANEGYLVNADGSNKQTLPRTSAGLTPTSAFAINSTGTMIVGQGRSSNGPISRVPTGIVYLNAAEVGRRFDR